MYIYIYVYKYIIYYILYIIYYILYVIYCILYIIQERRGDLEQPPQSGRDPKSINRDHVWINIEYSSTADHMNRQKQQYLESTGRSFSSTVDQLKCSKTSNKCSFQKSWRFGESGEAFGSQNRILLNHRPHENLKDDGIWGQRPSFSTKSRLPLGFFWGLVCEIFPN